MTNEEMIKDLGRIMDLLDMHIDLNQSLNITQMEFAYLRLKCIVKALEQQPCEDAISREAVEEMIKAEMPERGMWEIEGDTVKNTVCEVCVDLMQELSKLPSVTSQPKTGHWIIDIKDEDYCICSECKHRFDVDHLKFSWDIYAFPPHCPNCGAKMTESEE